MAAVIRHDTQDNILTRETNHLFYVPYFRHPSLCFGNEDDERAFKDWTQKAIHTASLPVTMATAGLQLSGAIMSSLMEADRDDYPFQFHTDDPRTWNVLNYAFCGVASLFVALAGISRSKFRCLREADWEAILFCCVVLWGISVIFFNHRFMEWLFDTQGSTRGWDDSKEEGCKWCEDYSALYLTFCAMYVSLFFRIRFHRLIVLNTLLICEFLLKLLLLQTIREEWARIAVVMVSSYCLMALAWSRESESRDRWKNLQLLKEKDAEISAQHSIIQEQETELKEFMHGIVPDLPGSLPGSLELPAAFLRGSPRKHSGSSSCCQDQDSEGDSPKSFAQSASRTSSLSSLDTAADYRPTREPSRDPAARPRYYSDGSEGGFIQTRRKSNPNLGNDDGKLNGQWRLDPEPRGIAAWLKSLSIDGPYVIDFTRQLSLIRERPEGPKLEGGLLVLSEDGSQMSRIGKSGQTLVFVREDKIDLDAVKILEDLM